MNTSTAAIVCKTCGYMGSLDSYVPAYTLYSHCRCPKCYSTNNAYNDQYRMNMIVTIDDLRRKKQASSLVLNENQKIMLNVLRNDNYKTILFKRQSGVTTALAVYAIEEAFKKDNAVIGYISFNEESAKRFINYIQQHMGDGYYHTEKNSITLKNGSKILVTSSQCKSWFTAWKLDLVLVDNCTLINNLTEIKQTLIPGVFSNRGKMFLCGTFESNTNGFIADMDNSQGFDFVLDQSKPVAIVNEEAEKWKKLYHDFRTKVDEIIFGEGFSGGHFETEILARVRSVKNTYDHLCNPSNVDK